ncbi:hypothetical protein ACQZV8_21120, partial [Magnetococcales bacterium HHB-1]
MKATEEITDQVITLLTLFGAEAVCKNPSLPLRILSVPKHFSFLSSASRPLLSWRIQPTESGDTHGGGGVGMDVTGIGRQGSINSLLPSQWVLPREVFYHRAQSGGLLYRTRQGGEIPPSHPAIIILDISPPTFGLVEQLTRPAAFLIAQTLLKANQPVVLILAAEQPRSYVLQTSADLLYLFIERDIHPVDINRTMKIAQEWFSRIQRQYNKEPSVFLLSHV